MATPSTSLRSPLGRVRGLGSAKEGVAHWWAQRLTALALIPLTLWFVISVISLAGAGHARTVAWIAAPVPAVLLVLLIAATFYHAVLGLQVVIEDYIHNEALRLGLIIVVKAAAVVLGAAAIFAVLKLALA
jgi:succinate dehydrogenase / fumarate reductase, membrane anchor subunit